MPPFINTPSPLNYTHKKLLEKSCEKLLEKSCEKLLDSAENTSCFKSLIDGFESIEISTKTVMVTTNWEIDIKSAYTFLPITPFIPTYKKRGRKKKCESNENKNKHLTFGSIICIQDGENMKGVPLRIRKRNNLLRSDGVVKKKKYFPNCLVITMWIDKFINFKLYSNGKFQITGCKYSSNELDAVKVIYNLLKDHPSLHILPCPTNDTCGNTINDTISIETRPFAVFNSVMSNIKFKLGFNINREKLDTYINKNSKYASLLETSFGYTGVNIKIPYILSEELKLTKLYLDDNSVSTMTLRDYISLLPCKEKKKESYTHKNTTFLVFYNGVVLMSTKDKNLSFDIFKEFLKVIEESKDNIMEKLL